MQKLTFKVVDSDMQRFGNFSNFLTGLLLATILTTALYVVGQAFMPDGPRVLGVVANSSNDYPSQAWDSKFEPGNIDIAQVVDGALQLNGWAGPDTDGVLVRLSGGSNSTSVLLFDRPDVAEYFADLEYTNSGFSVALPIYNAGDVSILCVWMISGEMASLRFAADSTVCG